jgi:hypothetical protein
MKMQKKPVVETRIFIFKDGTVHITTISAELEGLFRLLGSPGEAKKYQSVDRPFDSKRISPLCG